MKEDGYFEGVLKSSRKDEQDINNLVYGFIVEDNYNIYMINDNNNSAVHIFSFKNGVFNGICLENGCYEFSYVECNIELLDIENTNVSEELKNFKISFTRKDRKFYREKANYLKNQILIYGKNKISE